MRVGRISARHGIKQQSELFGGVLQGLLNWQTGKELEIEEAQCRAQDAPTCMREISKKTKE